MSFEAFKVAAPVCFVCGVLYAAIVNPEIEVDHPHALHREPSPPVELRAVHEVVVTSTSFFALTVRSVS